MKRIFPFFLVCMLSFPLFSGDNIYPEIEVDPNIHPAPLVGYRPRVVYDNHNSRFFVVWVNRDPRVEVYGIFAAFVDENTFEVTKAMSIVPEIKARMVELDVAYDGEKYFIVYTDNREIYGIFVSLDGTPYPDGPFIIRQNNPAGRNFRNPNVTFNWNPSNPVYLVTWSAEYEITLKESKVTKRLIAGIRLDKNGNKLDDENRIISAVELSPNFHPASASDGEGFVVVWSSQGNYILSRHISNDGFISPSIYEISSHYDADTLTPLNIAYTPVADRYLVTYRYSYQREEGIKGTFLNSQGEPFQELWIYEGLAGFASGIDKAKFNFYVQAFTGRAVLVRKVDVYGNWLGPVKLISVIDGFGRLRPWLAKGDSYILSVWEAQPYTTLRGRIIDANLNIVYPVDRELLISRGLNSQTEPAVAYGDSLYLVVWEDNRKGGKTGFGIERGIYGSFLNYRGKLINPGFEIADIEGEIEFAPNVAFGGNKFLVVYIKNFTNLAGRFVSLSNIVDEFIIDDNVGIGFTSDPIALSSGTNRFLICYPKDEQNVKIVIMDLNGQIIKSYTDFVPLMLRSDEFSSVYGKINQNGYFLVKFPTGLENEYRVLLIDEITGEIIRRLLVSSVHSLDFKNDTFYIYHFGGLSNKLYVKKLYPPDLYVSPDIFITEFEESIKDLRTKYDGWEDVVIYSPTADRTIGYMTLFQKGSEIKIFSQPALMNTINNFNYEPELSKGPGNQLLLTYESRKADPMRVYARFLEFFEVDDSLSLAVNSNVNIARDPLTDTIHIVFGRKDRIYYRKGFMLERTLIGKPRILWEPAFEIGKGFDSVKGYTPSLTLDYNGNPHITWVRNDTVLYRRRESGIWSQEYTISYEPNVSKFSPVITVSKNQTLPERVHILYADANPGMIRQRITEAYFPIDNPLQITEIPVYQAGGFVTGVLPSVDFLGNLHLSFEVLSDVTGIIYYATRDLTSNEWQVWGNVFPYGLGERSITPMTEVYGDSVYIVWTRLMDDGQYDVVKASHHIENPPDQRWNAGNFSRTPTSVQNPYFQAPVNSRGLYTVWVDVSGTGEYDVFTRDPFNQDLLRDLTNSEGKAIFPEIFSLFRRRPATSLLGLVWLQEDITQPQPLYNISSRIFGFIPLYYPAYYTLQGGGKTPSIHLTYRDTFIDTWTYPVDIGYDSISAKFYLDPRFQYEIVVQAYLEKEERIYSHDDDEEEWEQEIYLDGKKKKKMEIEFGELEGEKLFVPPGFYRDGVLRVKIKRKKGDFAVIHRILVYRYDKTGGGEFKGTGIQTENSVSLIKEPLVNTLIGSSLLINFPEKLRERKSVYIYNISGRRVYDFILEPGKRTYRIGLRENTLPSGIYLLRMDKKFYRIIKLR